MDLLIVMIKQVYRATLVLTPLKGTIDNMLNSGVMFELYGSLLGRTV